MYLRLKKVDVAFTDSTITQNRIIRKFYENVCILYGAKVIQNKDNLKAGAIRIHIYI